MNTNKSTAMADAPAESAREAESHDRERVSLFEEEQCSALRRRWNEVQTGFVDEPRTALQRADSLVADVLKQLADGFAARRTTLEQQWNRDGNVTTEDLRLTLQRYRSFFDRLLSLD